ncbi:MAG: RodZ domain-containing protein [Pseudomonadota bacterium]
MIGRRPPPTQEVEPDVPRGFDDFDLRIGDVMRGERATLGKSLLDVQRELKIKATYIAAIENADISAFESTGFIAGYVRSYARYLGLDPEWTFETFCAEADFVPLTGMEKVVPSAASKGRIRGPVFRREPTQVATQERDPIAQPRVSFAPTGQSAFASLEPRAIGSTLVLLALIGGIGYGGWAVLKEVQRVTVAPVERAPDAVAQVDPLDGVHYEGAEGAPVASGITPGTPDALAQLYRPQTLEAPVMVARDGPIASINPEAVGALASSGLDAMGNAPFSPSELYEPLPDAVAMASRGLGADAGVGGTFDPATDPLQQAASDALAQLRGDGPAALPPPRVTADAPEVMLIAVRPAWVRVRAADGSVLLERTLSAGDSWVVPPSDVPPTLRAGAAGAVFFTVNGQTFGPAGADGAVVDQIALGSESLSAEFALVDPEADADAREAIAYAEAAIVGQAQPDVGSDPSQ